MLKTRVIPTLLVKDFGLVKGEGFDSWRRVGTTLPAIKVYNRRCVDELIVVDISATQNNRKPDIDAVKQFSPNCFVPLTVGGGVYTVDDIKNLLRAGADKVVINTACYHNDKIIREAAELFGSQCIVVSIDAKKQIDGTYQCYSHSGSVAQQRTPESWAREVVDKGAGEILLTSIERDGTMTGYDLELIKSVTEAVSIPVIASGGAANYTDLCLAIKQGGAQAVAASSMFHFTEQTPLEAKAFLASQGISVRK